MGERERQRTRETEISSRDTVGEASDRESIGPGLGRDSGSDVEKEFTRSSTRETAREHDSGASTEDAGKRFSTRALGLSLGLAVAGVLVGGGLLPLGILGELVGIALVTFLYGLSARRRRYFEVGLAGGIVGGTSAFLSALTLTVLGVGIPLVAVGAGGGLLAGVLGHYYGRDLREGLTREL